VALGAKAVLLTAGRGAVHVVTRDGGEVDVPVPTLSVVDTIGAGDSFGGGFLAWWQASGRSIDELGSIDALVHAVRAAIQVAAIVVTRRGADPPWRAELPSDWSA
jgi:fructokinase